MEIKFSNKISKEYTQVSFSEETINSFSIENNLCSINIGIGLNKDLKKRQIFFIPRKIISFARQNKINKIALDYVNFKFKHLNFSDSQLGELIGVNLEIANYEFVKFKTINKDQINFVNEVLIKNASDRVQKYILKGQIIGKQINECRNLSNTPASELTPETLAEITKQIAEGLNIQVKVLDVDDMKILGMGGVLGVGQGSSNPPRFIIMEYFGSKDKKEVPIVMVGKGITYDSGGINLKPSNAGFLTEMHMDMTGGSVVINTLLLAARFKIKKNIVALIPSAENMISGSSYRPGDILKSMSGQTIEIGNTDAEGRVILADALTYAEKYNPDVTINVATLTTAAIIAVGTRTSVFFTKDLELEQKVRSIGDDVGDYMWPLPLWDEYAEDIKGIYGDWSNLGKTPMFGGAITAAQFLYQFAKKHNKFIHFDIAPTMFSVDGQYLAKGATGSPMMMLFRLLEN